MAQLAGVAAFEPESYAEVGRAGRALPGQPRRAADGLPKLGIDRLAPADGGFYVYADVSHLTADSMAFCRRLLAETGVAVAPGIDFDPVHGDRFVRLCYAGATDDLHEALVRLGDWLPGLTGA